MMGTGMIYANNFIVLVFFIAFSAFSYGCNRDGYVVFHKSEQSNENGKYYKEISYKLIEELESRCLYIIESKSVSPRFIGGDEVEVSFESVYSSSRKSDGACVMSYAAFTKESLVFVNFELGEFKYIESEVQKFISSDNFRSEFIAKLNVADFYVFSLDKSDNDIYIMSVIADGVVYEVLTELSGGAMKIILVKKSPDINL